MMKVNPKKLLNSKWTAVATQHKEKHFLVKELELDENGIVVRCVMEAIMTKREFDINWRDLNQQSDWTAGWR